MSMKKRFSITCNLYRRKLPDIAQVLNIYVIHIKLVGAGAFLSVAWPTGVQLLVFFCSSVPVVLFDTPGISGYRSQHVVSVESSSLFHHSIYL